MKNEVYYKQRQRAVSGHLAAVSSVQTTPFWIFVSWLLPSGHWVFGFQQHPTPFVVPHFPPVACCRAPPHPQCAVAPSAVCFFLLLFLLILHLFCLLLLQVHSCLIKTLHNALPLSCCPLAVHTSPPRCTPSSQAFQSVKVFCFLMRYPTFFCAFPITTIIKRRRQKSFFLHFCFTLSHDSCLVRVTWGHQTTVLPSLELCCCSFFLLVSTLCVVL